jgi:hypothetical protein
MSSSLLKVAMNELSQPFTGGTFAIEHRDDAVKPRQANHANEGLRKTANTPLKSRRITLSTSASRDAISG